MKISLERLQQLIQEEVSVYLLKKAKKEKLLEKSNNSKRKKVYLSNSTN